MGDPLQEEMNTRRSEDRDRMLTITTKLDQLEKDNRDLDKKVTALETSLTVVKLEQVHIKDLMDARLKVIEASNQLQLSEIRALSMMLNNFSTDIDKSPLGRTFAGLVGSCRASIDEQSDRLDSHLKEYALTLQWRDRVDGVLFVLKWIGGGSFVALIVTLLRSILMKP